MTSFIVSESGELVVETYRSGHFKFQIGLDFDALDSLKEVADHAYARFASMPRVGDMANQLEQLAFVTSVYSTNTIEGGELSEDETANVLTLDPSEAKSQAEKRVLNLKSAYSAASDFSKYIYSELTPEEKESNCIQGRISIDIDEYMIKVLHKWITEGLDHPDNTPGLYRNNTKSQKTRVGDQDHGGVYSPPKCIDDIKLLMEAFSVWANSEPVSSLPPLYRAPLIHHYFERIHPFWDGNGRTGRVLEAIVLQGARYMLAPYAISQYYLQNIDIYFSLFNSCRKKSQKKELYPNTEFVKFHLVGMIATVNRLHDKANLLIYRVLFNSNLNFLFTNKKINERQHMILTYLMTYPYLTDKKALMSQPWYGVAYKRLTDRTKQRDLKKMEELGLIEETGDHKIKISYARPDIELSSYDVTNVSFA